MADKTDETIETEETTDEQPVNDQQQDDLTVQEGQQADRQQDKTDGGDETIQVSAAEHRQVVSELNRLKRQESDREKARRQAERDKQRAEGNLQAVLKSVEEERDTAARERDDARVELTTERRTTRVTRIASKLNFRDPTDVKHFVDGEAQDDDRATEVALRNLARAKPYLVDQQRRSGAPVNGGSGGQGATAQDEHANVLATLLGAQQ